MQTPSEWEILRTDATLFATWLASRHSARAGELIVAESEKFANQPPPADAAELRLRQLQHRALTGIKIGGISQADSMARLHPSASERIYGELMRLCSLALPMSDDDLRAQARVSSEVIQAIASFCEADKHALGGDPEIPE